MCYSLGVENIPRLLQRSNQHFTYSYEQPPEYQFCQDSVLFPIFVASYLRDQEINPGYRVLDVCSGCGVIGFELTHHEKRISTVDFFEIQTVFYKAFIKNLEITNKDPQLFRFLNESFSRLNENCFSETYDLIVGNPPYFFATDGLNSQTNRSVQDRCRFFLDASLRELILGTANALKRSGQAFLLVKSGIEHGRNSLREIRIWLGAAAGQLNVHFECRIAAEIRGTLVLQISKN